MGSWYGVGASFLGILFFLVTVEIIGVALFRYHPVHLLVDLLYIFCPAFAIGSLSALGLGYLVGGKAARQIATDSKHFAKIGTFSALTVLVSSVIVGIVVLGILTDPKDYQAMASSVLGGLMATFLVVVSIGYIPAKIVGYDYGKAVQDRIMKII